MSTPIASDRPPPSMTSIVIGTAILAVALGYFIGQGSSLGIFGSPTPPNRSKPKSKNPKKSWPNSYDVTIHPDSSDEEVFKQIRGADLGIESEESSEDSSSDEAEVELGQKQEGLNQFEGNREECKLVLVVRTDLGMGKGTAISQPFHLLSKTTLSNPPPPPPQVVDESANNTHRQDRSSMLPRNPGLLPRPLLQLPLLPQPRPETMGAHGSGQSRPASQERGRIGDLAGASSQPRAVRANHS